MKNSYKQKKKKKKKTYGLVSSIGAASAGATPNSGSCQAAVDPAATELTAEERIPSAAFFLRHGIQKQHFFTSVSSPVLGSILFTERQQNILLKHKPHLLCLGGPMGLNDCSFNLSSFLRVVDDNVSGVALFFLQLLQQFNFCQHEVFFGCFSSTISR